jgi:hypothetical protein
MNQPMAMMPPHGYEHVSPKVREVRGSDYTPNERV